jgi:phosphoribosylformylglycinamidine synthase PurS subunit
MTAQDASRLREWIAEVIVVPKAGVNDPQGEAIRGGLGSLGYSGVSNVRSGRFFRLTLHAENEATATAEATEMCQRLLANPVIETFTVALHPAILPGPNGESQQ